MTNPFVKPTLTGYNPSPAPDTGAAGGSANIVRWSKHIDEIGNPLRDWAQSIADATEDAFESMFGTGEVDLLFAMAAAPTGWTQRTSINDRVLRLVSGTGLGTGGSWEVSGLTLPSHTHGAGSLSASQSGDSEDVGSGAANTVADNTHTHNVTGTTGGSGTLTVNSNSAWRPNYLDIIRCFRSFA